jgi:hypothetical protein
MISNSSGLGEIIIIVFDVILLCIPVFVVWLLFKTLKKYPAIVSRSSRK